MKVGQLRQQHPEYDEKCLQRQRALYEGNDPWRDLVSTWFPKHPDEMDDSYEHRKSLSTYENHTGPIVDVLAAAVFAEDPKVEGVTGDWWQKFAANVDGAGTDLAPWFRDRLVDLLVERTTYVFANLPARAGAAPESRADEEAAGLLDAFLVWVSAQQVIDWADDERGRLRWLLIEDCVEERASVDAKRTTVWRWTYVDAAVIRRWTWSPPEGSEKRPPQDNDEATELPAIQHGFGEVPVARLSLTKGLHALGKLHDPAIAHLRARNNLSYALDRAAHALLVVKDEWDDKKPVLGSGYFLRVGKDGDVFYAEPSGANFTILAEDVKDLREELYRVVQQMAQGLDTSASRSAQSGDSKSQDWRSMEIVLSALAGVMLGAIGEVVRLVALARKQQVEPVVSGLDGWQEEDLTTWLEAAAMATDARRFSETFNRLVAKKQARRVLQGEDPKLLEQVDKEIDEAEVDLSLFSPTPPGGAGPPGDDEGAEA